MAGAQEGPKTGSPVARAAIDLDHAPRPSARAARTAGPISIDGTLDEADWAVAPVIDEFFQQKPDAGMPSSERTEVRILYDDRNLYIGAELFDSDPDWAPIIPTLQRDPNTRDGDAFGFSLDTFLDGESSYAFIINPGGALRDTQTREDGRINNAAWDSAYELRTRVHDGGWTVEISIPWRSLRFDGSSDEQTWGLNLLRRIRKRNEDATWAPMDRKWPLYTMSRAGRLGGLQSIRPSRDLTVKPFALAAQPSGELQAGATTDFDGGLDLKYGITPGVTLDVTANTDFSQVEVDQEQVNLTRFSLFFPEKREFFLENAGIFQFGDQGGFQERNGAASRDFTLFHSRRIGLTPSGSPIPILGGGRISGTAGPLSVGFLNMQTQGKSEFDPENFTVARALGEVSEGLSLGGIFINRAATSGGRSANRSYGVDANYRALGGYLLVESYLAGTEGTDENGAALDRGFAGRMSAAWRDPFWEVVGMYRQFGEAFNPGTGFVRRKAVRHLYGSVGVHPRVTWPLVQVMNPYVEVHDFTAPTGALETREVKAGLDVDMTDGSTFQVALNDVFERVDEPFSVQGAVIDAGSYDFTELTASVQVTGSRRVSGRLNVSRGGYFGGDRFSVGGNVLGRLGHQVLLDLSIERNRIDLPDLSSVTADVYGGKLDVFLSTRLLTSAFVQYNEATGEVITNARLNWIHAPLSDLYLVLTERRDTRTGHALDRFLTLKVTKLLSL